MKYILVSLFLANMAYAVTPTEIRKELKEGQQLMIDLSKKSCTQSKDKTACNIVNCLNGDDQACLDYQKSLENGDALKKLDGPKVQQDMKAMGDLSQKNIEKYSSPEDLKKLGQLKNDCAVNNQSRSCAEHDKLRLRLIEESSLKDIEMQCKNGDKTMCDMLPQVREFLKKK